MRWRHPRLGPVRHLDGRFLLTWQTRIARGSDDWRQSGDTAADAQRAARVAGREAGTEAVDREP